MRLNDCLRFTLKDWFINYFLNKSIIVYLLSASQGWNIAREIHGQIWSMSYAR